MFAIMYRQRENTRELRPWWRQKLGAWQHSQRSVRRVLDAELHWIDKVIDHTN